MASQFGRSTGRHGTLYCSAARQFLNLSQQFRSSPFLWLRACYQAEPCLSVLLIRLISMLICALQLDPLIVGCAHVFSVFGAPLLALQGCALSPNVSAGLANFKNCVQIAFSLCDTVSSCTLQVSCCCCCCCCWMALTSSSFGAWLCPSCVVASPDCICRSIINISITSFHHHQLLLTSSFIAVAGFIVRQCMFPGWIWRPTEQQLLQQRAIVLWLGWF